MGNMETQYFHNVFTDISLLDGEAGPPKSHPNVAVRYNGISGVEPNRASAKLSC